MAKLNQRDLSVSDIGDYIRQRYKSGAKSIVWGKHGLEVFKKHLKFLFGRSIVDKIHGIKFCGIRHYIRNYKK